MELNWDDLRKRTVYNAHLVEKVFFSLLLRKLMLQGWTGHCGNTVIAARLYVENARLFLRMRVFFKGFEAFSKISILFEDIFREIEAFFN
jgi:hypothetical protein